MPKLVLTRQRVELARRIRTELPAVPLRQIAKIIGVRSAWAVSHAIGHAKREYRDEFDRFNLARILREHAHKLEHEFPTP